jgi:cytochrome P450
MASIRPRAPGPRGLPLSGNLWSISQDVLSFLLQAEARYGAVVRTRLGPVTYHLVSDPALAEQVLWRQAERYTRDSPSSRKLQDITGSSLLTTVGPAWLARRKLIAPYFTRAHILARVPMMTALAERHLERWASSGAERALDATAWLMQLTCSIASQVLFGVAVEDPALSLAMDGILSHHWRRLRDPLQLAHRLPTRSRQAFDAGNRVVAEIVGGLGTTSGVGTLLGALQEAAAAGGVAGLRVQDELITLLIAGHETTANALGWALHLLAVHPEEQQRLRDEASAAGPQALAQIELPTAVRVFQEAMRLYPPIWLIERQALLENQVGGFPIAPGGSIIVSPWVMHRSQRFWDRPEQFLPERFRRAPAKHSFIPFGLGPHACVGSNLAMTEGPLLLALIARRWRWRPQPRTLVAPQPGLTLRMRRPLRLLVEAA